MTKLRETDRKCIAEVCFSPSWGGIEHYCANMAYGLTQRGHEVLGIARLGSPLEKCLAENGLKCVSLRSRNYLSPLTTLKLAKVFGQQKIHAIHLHRTHDLGVVLPAADLAGVPIRVLTLQMESGRRKHDLYHRYVYSRLTAVLTITERIRKKTIQSVAVDPEKVHRLYYGVDAAALREKMLPRKIIRERWNIPEEAFVVGMVGRLEPAKGQEILLRAAAALKSTIPELVIMLVGEETIGQHTELPRLRRLAAELLPPDSVVFTGYQHPPGVVVPAFDVAVLATKRESFGLVILEAMALGVPVIGTADGGVLEIIDTGVNGMLFPPGDFIALSQAISTLHAKPELLPSLGNMAYETVIKRFSMENHYNTLENILLQ